jgi:hypothetical protein
MKRSDVWCSKLLPVMILVLVMVLDLNLPAPAGADMAAKLGLSQKFGLQAKKNLGPAVTMNQTLFNVKLPLKISKMPGPWKNASFVGVAMVYFMDGPGEAIGYATTKNGDGEMPLNISLNDGSYDGTVVLPIQNVAGTISGKTCSVAYVMAKTGNQLMFIGASKGGTAPNSGVCAKMNALPIAPGTILSN